MRKRRLALSTTEAMRSKDLRSGRKPAPHGALHRYLGAARLRPATEKDRELLLQPDFRAPFHCKVAPNPTADTRPPPEVVSAEVGGFDLRALKLAGAAE